MLPGAYFQVWTGVNNFNKCVNQGLLMTEYKGKPPQVGLAIYGPQKRKLIIAWTCLGSKSVTKRNLNMFPKAMQGMSTFVLANTAGKVNRFKKKKMLCGLFQSQINVCSSPHCSKFENLPELSDPSLFPGGHFFLPCPSLHFSRRLLSSCFYCLLS